MTAKKVIAIVLACVAVLLIAFVTTLIIKLTIYKKIMRIQSYSNTLINEYSDDGMLDNYNTLNEVLDRFEGYLTENNNQLSVKSYERTDASIIVTLCFGQSYIFSPMVRGCY